MRKATVKYNKEVAGVLTQLDDETFVFEYDQMWFDNPRKPAISLNMPKTIRVYTSKTIFPFFFHMLPEGANLNAVCKYFRLDKDDYFGILMTVAEYDTIGAVTIHKQ